MHWAQCGLMFYVCVSKFLSFYLHAYIYGRVWKPAVACPIDVELDTTSAEHRLGGRLTCLHVCVGVHAHVGVFCSSTSDACSTTERASESKLLQRLNNTCLLVCPCRAGAFFFYKTIILFGIKNAMALRMKSWLAWKCHHILPLNLLVNIFSPGVAGVVLDHNNCAGRRFHSSDVLGIKWFVTGSGVLARKLCFVLESVTCTTTAWNIIERGTWFSKYFFKLCKEDGMKIET